jgi:hypothetical protein
MKLKEEIGYEHVDWIQLTHNAAVNSCECNKKENFLNVYSTIRFSRRTWEPASTQ